MTMIVTNGDTEIRFALNDSPAARSLAVQLPLTLEVRPFGGNEQTFYPPQALDTADTPAITSAQAGTLAYYARGRMWSCSTRAFPAAAAASTSWGRSWRAGTASGASRGRSRSPWKDKERVG